MSECEAPVHCVCASVEKREMSGSDGPSEEDLSSRRISAIVKPPKSPAVSGAEQSSPMRGREISYFIFNTAGSDPSRTLLL